MWIIKTKEEYKKGRNKDFKTTFIASIILSITIIFFISIMSKFGCRGWNPHQYELSWKQFLEGILGYLIFIPLIIISFMVAKHFDERRLICDKCSKDKNTIFKNQCSCGGQFINIKKYKWIKEPTDQNIPTYDEVKNLSWNDFQKKYNLELTNFKFLKTTLDVPKKYQYSNPNLYLVIENILELSPENSYLQIIMKNKSYIQVTLNSEENFILVHYDKKSYLVESSRDLGLLKVIDALNLYYNNYSGFKDKFQWVELVNTI